jgi:hypothetical protein
LALQLGRYAAPQSSGFWALPSKDFHQTQEIEMLSMSPQRWASAAALLIVIFSGFGMIALWPATAADSRAPGSSADLSGAWTLNGDFKLNGMLDADPAAKPQHFKLMITKVSADAYTGTFVGMPDPSTFTLSFSHSQRGQVLQMLQTNAQTAYFAAYVGHVTQGANALSVQGSWVDVENKTGDFSLTRP